MTTKWELQDKNNPHARIVVCTIQQVHDLEAHGWRRIPATVTPAKSEGKKS